MKRFLTIPYMDNLSSLGILVSDWSLALNLALFFEVLLFLSRFIVTFDLLRWIELEGLLSCLFRISTGFFDEFLDLDKLYFILCCMESFLKQQRWVRYCHLANTLKRSKMGILFIYFDYHNAQVVTVELNMKKQFNTVSTINGSNMIRKTENKILRRWWWLEQIVNLETLVNRKTMAVWLTPLWK